MWLVCTVLDNTVTRLIMMMSRVPKSIPGPFLQPTNRSSQLAPAVFTNSTSPDAAVRAQRREGITGLAAAPRSEASLCILGLFVGRVSFLFVSASQSCRAGVLGYGSHWVHWEAVLSWQCSHQERLGQAVAEVISRILSCIWGSMIEGYCSGYWLTG